MEEKLLNIAIETLETDDITLDMMREEIEKWDSMAHISLIATVEDELGINIPFEKVGEINCLRDILNFA